MTHQVGLAIALSSYDHTLDLTSGAVAIPGTRPDFVAPPFSEMFRRFIAGREWDVSEVSLVEYAMLRAAGDDAIVAIPVFTSRMFSHSAIYVRADRIDAPAQLRGSRVGIPGWADPVGVWARGLLGDMYGLAAAEMEWWVSRVDGSSTAKPLHAPAVPSGVRSHEVGDRSLVEMLREGDLDALITSVPPEGVMDGDGEVRRLFAEDGSAECAYYRHTGCLPVMNTVAARRDVLERHPWLATNLYRAFEVAKRRYFVRLTEISASRTPIPWVAAYVNRAQALFGTDLWPYGIDDNRRSLEVFLRYGNEQGLFARPLSVHDLFASVEPFVANEQ
jgi:4,5-dihydroxyphthalate decarboxylase